MLDLALEGTPWTGFPGTECDLEGHHPVIAWLLRGGHEKFTSAAEQPHHSCIPNFARMGFTV